MILLKNQEVKTNTRKAKSEKSLQVEFKNILFFMETNNKKKRKSH